MWDFSSTKDTLIRLKAFTSEEQRYFSFHDVYRNKVLPNVLANDENGELSKYSNNNGIYEAILTQEMNRAGRLTLKGNKNLLSMALDTKYFIDVKCPYTKEGVPAIAASVSPWTQTWRGIFSSYTETPSGATVVYDGELSLLDKVILEPYSYQGNLIDYTRHLINNKYNSSIGDYVENDVYYPNTYNVDEDGLQPIIGSSSVTRKNSSVTTVWQELNNKVLKKYDVRLNVVDSDTPSIYQRPHPYWRLLYFTRLTDDSRLTIKDEDIINISFGNNVASKIRTMHLYGKKQDESTEGDIGRIHAKTSYSGDWQSDVILPVSESYKIYDDIITETTLADRGADDIAQGIINADSIQVSLKPSVGEKLWLGEVYTITDTRIGISKKFRLIKRVINLLNPTKNTYTFGKVDLISAKDTDENDQNVSSAKTPITDNLDTETSGESALDAHQGKVLADMIEDSKTTLADNVTTTDAGTAALDAHRGKVLYDMMTDGNSNLYVNSLKADVNVNVEHPTNGVCIILNVNGYGNHGLASKGYYPGDARTMTESDYIEDFQWLFYRDSTGHVTIPRNLTVNKVTSSGSITGSQVGQYTFNAATSGKDTVTYRLANSLRIAGLELSSAGNAGIYDFTNNKWIFISEPNGSISRIKTQLYCLNTAGDERPAVTTVNDSGAHVAALRSTSTNQLHVYGEYGKAGTYKYMYVTMSTSDPRLKENIKNTVINALSIINQIPMHQFDWKTDGKHWDVGLIAPELYEIDPNLAIKPLPGEEDIAYWGVDSFYLTGMLTKAVQELSAENRELKQRLESLEERIARLEGSL